MNQFIFTKGDLLQNLPLTIIGEIDLFIRLLSPQVIVGGGDDEIVKYGQLIAAEVDDLLNLTTEDINGIVLKLQLENKKD